MGFGAGEALAGGATPGFAVDVTASGASYRQNGGTSSLDHLPPALHAAATYNSPTKTIAVVMLIGAVIAATISLWLLAAVVVGGVALLAWLSEKSARRRRVGILYQLDAASAQAFESIGNGVGWLASSRSLWRVTNEERARRPANTVSMTRVAARVSRGAAANIVANVAVASIAAGGDTLLVLPDALLIRDASSRFVAIPYAELKVEHEPMHFQETDLVPTDATRVGETWLYAKKDGSPDLRRTNNRRIPVLEYGRVTLSWRGSAWVLLVSNAVAAKHFASALQAMTPRRETPEAKMEIKPAVTEIERLLMASLERKRQSQHFERQQAAVAARVSKTVETDAQWIPQGGNATVHGLAIGDLLYVGTRLPALVARPVEPALIDPSLPVDLPHPNTSGDGMNYWPSYSSITAAQRAAVLQWLAGGRKDPNVYIGYVFIFFYGLERRVDEFVRGRGSNADELVTIGQEVARLLELLGRRSNSFFSYASSFLDLITTLEPRVRLLLRHQPIHPGFGVPLHLKMALGELAAAGKPIPADLALDWVRATYYLNTPAKRCEREFEILFRIRYTQEFGDGLILKPNKAFVHSSYHPASAGLEIINVRRDVPDVTALSRPAAKLTDLAQRCSDALDPYSRFLGKNRDGRHALAGFAVLPDELVEATPSPDVAALAALVRSRLDGEGRACVGGGELLFFVRLAKPDRVSRNEAVLLAVALEKLGYGVEPDVRLGGPVVELDGRAIVFRRLPDCPSAASDDYSAAMLLVRLCVIVSSADAERSHAERELIARKIEGQLDLTPGERQRLSAHFAWLLETDLGTSGLKRRLESLSQLTRCTIGKLLIEVAAEDGRIDPREMKMLEKLYALLELSTADLYRDVHAAQAGDEEPISVDEPLVAHRGFAIPSKPSAVLDMTRVRLKIAETREVSALLSEVFVDDEQAVAAIPVAATIGSLDAAHSELLRRLAARDAWPRHDVEQMAAELSLLIDGALETINDYAYATADEPFWEDDDPLAINTRVARELTQ